MADVKKIATRESYGNALVALGEKYDNLVVLDADLAEATKTGIFKKAFPERHIDCGSRYCKHRKGSILLIICNVCSRSCFRAGT